MVAGGSGGFLAPTEGTAMRVVTAWMIVVLGSSPGLAADPHLDVVVVDAQTGAPVPQAFVVVGDVVGRADEEGRLTTPVGPTAYTLSARAWGYRRTTARMPWGPGPPVTLALQPVRPRGLYLSALGVANDELREGALRVIEVTELNALIIDVKGDTGVIPFHSVARATVGLSLQTSVGVPDMAGLLARLHAQGLYVIGRVVVFKDDVVATTHPAWAVKGPGGVVWRDNEGLAWLDPTVPASWTLSLALAEEAAILGFDEVQFDYVRFPDAPGLKFSQPLTQERRVAAIGGFLDAARARLAPFNVFTSADIFGYVCWNTDDTQIGQQLEGLVDRVDYLSPMLYPSGFTFGIPGHRLPVAAPYEIVNRTLQAGMARIPLASVRWRPWLQSFTDYAFDFRAFGAHEIRAQIDASEVLGTDGWMLWNAPNRYSLAGLKLRGAPDAGVR